MHSARRMLWRLVIPYVGHRIVYVTTFEYQGPDLQNVLRQSCDYRTIMPELRSTYDGRLICETSYERRKAFLRYNSLAKS